MSLEDKLAEYLKQPGAYMTGPEAEFIVNMRKAASQGVGYGWMQQVIEWEWRSKHGGSWGPEFFGRVISDLENKVTNLEAEITLMRKSDTP